MLLSNNSKYREPVRYRYPPKRVCRDAHTLPSPLLLPTLLRPLSYFLTFFPLLAVSGFPSDHASSLTTYPVLLSRPEWGINRNI